MAHKEEILVNGVLTEVQKLDHSAEQVDDAVGRALPGGDIETQLSKKVNMPRAIPAGADLNDYTTPGLYYCPDDATAATIINAPTGGSAFSLFVEFLRGGNVFQTLKQWRGASRHASVTFMRCSYPAWGEWEQQATATKPQELALPLAAGWTEANPCVYSKGQDSRVFVHIDVDAGTPVGQMALICTLPHGYRPRDIKRFVATSINSGVGLFCFINAVGDIYVYPYGSVASVVADVSFLAT